MKKIVLGLIALAFTLQACSQKDLDKSDKTIFAIADYVNGKGYEKYDVATLAGGCFWCVEAAFDRIEGVVDVISGYSGGEKAYPTYYEVGYGNTKHAEAVQIYFDPNVVSFETLLEVFFVAHDPTQLNRQGPDVGPQYRSAIFYQDKEQLQAAKDFIETQEKAGVFEKKIVTELKAYKEFWVAEAYHQDFYELNPNQSYVRSVSRPKVKKVEKAFKDILKSAYQ